MGRENARMNNFTDGLGIAVFGSARAFGGIQSTDDAHQVARKSALARFYKVLKFEKVSPKWQKTRSRKCSTRSARPWPIARLLNRRFTRPSSKRPRAGECGWKSLSATTDSSSLLDPSRRPGRWKI